MKLIFVPQFPTECRYQEFWFTEFPKHLKESFDEIIVLGQNYINKKVRGKLSMFSPIEESIKFECEQIKEYTDLEIDENKDILFLSDLSFPGLFVNILFHKRPKKCFSFCHATSLNHLDYFEDVRDLKFPIETSHAKLFNKVFVGSQYHKDKLKWFNTEITYLPKPPFETFKEEKIYNIISVARPCEQKITKSIEDKVEKEFGSIIRRTLNSWEQYYKFLSYSKVLLISSTEDTFGYTILEAVMNNTIPIAPNKLCFPELLPREYLYDDYDELKDTLFLALNGELKVPELLCNKEIDNFYKRISEEMLKG